MRGAESESAWWTVAESADRVTINAAFRGALQAQRARIADFTIDVTSDEPWPEDVRRAIGSLESRLAGRRSLRRFRWLRRSPGYTLDLDLGDDDDLALAMAIAPLTIGGTGISHAGRIIWDGNDTGTSGAFDLTPDELEEVRTYVTDHDGDPAHLMPMDHRGPVFS